MSDYPDNEQDRKKALAANEKFHKPDETKNYTRARIDNILAEIEVTKDVDSKAYTGVDEFLHNAAYHLTQALKIIDGVK